MLKKTISQAPIKCEHNTDFTETRVTITYDGKPFVGFAFCHTDDKEFCSEKVGYSIAYYRAVEQIFKYEIEQQRVRIATLRKVLSEYPHYANFIESVIKRYQDTLNFHRDDLKRLRKSLNHYIEGQNRAIESIKHFRKNKDEEKK